MLRTVQHRLLVILFSIAIFVRADAREETAVPDFAVAKLSIAQMGVFLEKNADFANQLIPNIGPIAKIALANLLFKLPVDESLNFEGPVQIYIVPPLSFTASQDVATVLPVSDAEKVKKNVISLYGDPTEKDGAMMFAVPQPIPLPDRTLFVKVTKDKALLAPSAEILKQLEAVAGGPLMTGSDAELLISMPAVKKLYGDQINGALSFGARLAAGEEVEALKKLTDQMDTIQRTLWEAGTVELRLKFDQGSKNVHAELAVAPLKDTGLAAVFANPPPGLEGKDAALLAANAPVNIAVRMNGRAIFETLKELKLETPNTVGLEIDKKLFEFYSGEIVLALSRHYALQMLRSPDAEPIPQKFETLLTSIAALLSKKIAAEDGPDAPVFAVKRENAEYKGVQIGVRKLDLRKKDGTAVDTGMPSHIEHATVEGTFIVGFGPKPEDPIKELIDAAQAKTPVASELKAAFDAPPPGTLLLVSAKLIEIIRLALVETVADTVPPEQIVGNLTDAPIFASVFMNDGKAGLRLTLPGATTASVYQAVRRLRSHGVNVFNLLGVGGNKPEDPKLPGNVPPPPRIK